MRGRLIGTDPATDIALIKIDVNGLPAVTWGDSSKLQVGEWVLAIGSPFQLSQTVTAGIVSATGRANVGFAEYEDFIQTDAAINPGNSGGALINTRGELVGINTGIFSQSGGYQGIGFAVPSNLARHVVDDLKQFGEVHRGTIGGILTIDKVSPQYAEELARAQHVRGAGRHGWRARQRRTKRASGRATSSCGSTPPRSTTRRSSIGWSLMPASDRPPPSACCAKAVAWISRSRSSPSPQPVRGAEPPAALSPFT